jgi:hypothetical protein
VTGVLLHAGRSGEPRARNATKGIGLMRTRA